MMIFKKVSKEFTLNALAPSRSISFFLTYSLTRLRVKAVRQMQTDIAYQRRGQTWFCHVCLFAFWPKYSDRKLNRSFKFDKLLSSSFVINWTFIFSLGQIADSTWPSLKNHFCCLFLEYHAISLQVVATLGAKQSNRSASSGIDATNTSANS